jgi:hypothetical protein
MVNFIDREYSVVTVNLWVERRARLSRRTLFMIVADSFGSNLGGVWALVPFPCILSTFLYSLFSISSLVGMVIINAPAPLFGDGFDGLLDGWQGRLDQHR